jgi:hypothetical protein
MLSPDERAFIRQHQTADVRDLLLHPPKHDLPDLRRVVAQIAARQKAADKLPRWVANEAVFFPPALSVEQASSEATACHKASLVSGGVLLDLTGGMGVDAWAFAGRVAQVVYVDQNPELGPVAAHNFAQLGVANITTQTTDGLPVLQAQPAPVDWVYMDPARRNQRGGKVVSLTDCDPDLTRPDWQTALRRTNRLLLKTSPLIDIVGAMRQLPGAVLAVQVVAVQNEVKEVLFIVDCQANKSAIGALPNQPETTITAVNLGTTDTPFVFNRTDERAVAVTFGDPMAYLYEPNAALLKAGAFRSVAARSGLTKLAPHSHLYTSAELVSGFPGRSFQVEAVCKPDKKTLHALLPDGRAHLSTRNFPQSTDELRQRLGLRDGGEVYIFATTLGNGDKRLLISRKLTRNL